MRRMSEYSTDAVIRTKAETHFEKYRESLRRELMRLAAYSRVYQRLFDRKTDRLLEMNLAPAFFSTTADALFSAIITWVDKLFAKQGKRGILNFLTFAEHNRQMFDVGELQRRAKFSDADFAIQDRKAITLETIRMIGRGLLNSKPSQALTF